MCVLCFIISTNALCFLVVWCYKISLSYTSGIPTDFPTVISTSPSVGRCSPSWITCDALANGTPCSNNFTVLVFSKYVRKIFIKCHNRSFKCKWIRGFVKKGKRKGRVLYILCISQSAQAWITQFYRQMHHACLSFVSVHQMAPPLTEVRDIQLQLTSHLSTPKGWKAELAWLGDL